MTESDRLRVGDLHIITCTGTTIGSDSKAGHGVVIQDTGVSRVSSQIVGSTDWSQSGKLSNSVVN